ncbi:MAG: DUF2167 domain-containing protein [Verrucomicrobiota bacterium]
MKAIVAIALAVAFCLPAHADEKQPSPQEVAAIQKAMKAIGELQYKSGEISLAGGKVKLTLPPEFQYLDPSNARKVMVDIYGNPPQSTGGDGMIVPKGMKFFGGGGWIAELRWKDDGYVKDDEFAKLKFDDMLKELKESYHQGSEERVKGGYGKMELAAWAQQPHYDRTTHKLYYAKFFDTDGAEQQLNYDIRILGRQGVLELSIMSFASQMSDIEAKAPTILGMVDFTDGNRYTDYKPGKDKVAAYGIAGLIAGGVLAKAGFFKVIFLFAAKFFKVILVGLAALGAGIAKLFGRKKSA